MSRRLTAEEREAIHNDKRPVRVIAADYGKSPTSVQKWKKRDTFVDMPRNPPGSSGLSGFERASFLEMVRLTRYHYKYLFEYLAPLWPSLPTQSNCRKSSQAGQQRPTISTSTFFRMLKNHPSGSLIGVSNGNKTLPGEVAVHRVLIEWNNGDDETDKGELLLLMERASGLIYAKAYSRVKKSNVAVCIARIEGMLAYDIKALHFIFSTKPKDSRTLESKSTALLLDRATKIANRVSDNSRDILDDELTFDFPLFADVDTPHQMSRIRLPVPFEDCSDLNNTIMSMVNEINTRQRSREFRGKSIEITPLIKLQNAHKKRGNNISVQELETQIMLPRKWDFEYDIVPE